MRLLQIILAVFSLVCAAKYDCNAKCTNECARKLAAKEKTAHCTYVIRNFKSKTRTTCANPENDYQDLYKNYNITTLEQQYSEYRPCIEWISGMFFENMVYICILLWFICFVKWPCP